MNDSTSDKTYIKFNIERCNFNEWDENLREIEAIYAAFQSLGVPTVSLSRINAYRQAFKSLLVYSQQKRQLDLPLAGSIVNTMVEFHQMKTIVKAVKSSKNPEVWKDRLRPLISGAEFATRESNTASARDLQFESFVGAVCELSGYTIRYAEPDIILTEDSEVFGIAAKRPRNTLKIEKNYKKAVHQIRDSGLPGLIAIDLSFALQKDKCINTNDLSGAQMLVEEVANRFVRINYDRLRNLSTDDKILGALVHVQMPVINFGHPAGPQLATAIRWTVAPFNKSDEEAFRWGCAFSRKCEVGLFGPQPPEESLNNRS